MFFLFNDCLIYATRLPQSPQFKVHGQIPLRGVMVIVLNFLFSYIFSSFQFGGNFFYYIQSFIWLIFVPKDSNFLFFSAWRRGSIQMESKHYKHFHHLWRSEGADLRRAERRREIRLVGGSDRRRDRGKRGRRRCADFPKLEIGQFRGRRRSEAANGRRRQWRRRRRWDRNDKWR